MCNSNFCVTPKNQALYELGWPENTNYRHTLSTENDHSNYNLSWNVYLGKKIQPVVQ